MDTTQPPTLVSHESILFTHGDRTKRAYVLFHGLTASPLQFEAFGRQLFDRNANVYIPRLPHHGHGDRLTTALQNLTATEMRSFAVQTLEKAREHGEEIVLAGFSVGGLLTAWLAQHHAVARSVSIAPFLGVAFVPYAWTARVARIALRAPNQFWWWDPVLREKLGPDHGYPRFPTHAVAQVAILADELLDHARDATPATSDLHIVLNASETTVNNAAGRKLALRWTRNGRDVAVHRLGGLPLSHDIIEPLRSPALVRQLYPRLLDIVTG